MIIPLLAEFKPALTCPTRSLGLWVHHHGSSNSAEAERYGPINIFQATVRNLGGMAVRYGERGTAH